MVVHECGQDVAKPGQKLERSAVGRTLGQLFKVKTEEPERSVLLNHRARVRAGVTTKVFSVSVGFCAA